MKKDNKAFTLIELIVVIAIIGILAAVVLVSMSSFGKKARATKALAQLSSTIPSVYSCWGNGGTINEPDSDGDNEEDGTGNICSLGGSYGNWPSSDSGDLVNYRYGAKNISSNPSVWYIRFNSAAANDNVAICCNSAMKGCKITGDYSTWGQCGAATPTN